MRAWVPAALPLAMALTLAGTAQAVPSLNVSGDIFIGVRPGNAPPTCTEIDTPGFFDLTCSQPDFGEGRAFAEAILGPGAVPTLVALAYISTPPSAIGATAGAAASFRDTLTFSSAAETAEYVFQVQGTAERSGPLGDAAGAEFQFVVEGLGFLFREYSLGTTDEMISTIALIPLGREVTLEAQLRALAGAPAGGNVLVDFSTTVRLVDVIVRNTSGNQIFDPIRSESGALYGHSSRPVSEPVCTLWILAGLVGIARNRLRSR